MRGVRAAGIGVCVCVCVCVYVCTVRVSVRCRPPPCCRLGRQYLSTWRRVAEGEQTIICRQDTPGGSAPW